MYIIRVSFREGGICPLNARVLPPLGFCSNLHTMITLYDVDSQRQIQVQIF